MLAFLGYIFLFLFCFSVSVSRLSSVSVNNKLDYNRLVLFCTVCIAMDLRIEMCHRDIKLEQLQFAAAVSQQRITAGVETANETASVV